MSTQSESNTKLDLAGQWRKQGAGLKFLCTSLLTLGLVGLAAGLAGDVTSWWSSWPFLTNVVSGFTSACFGIPFAVLILGALNAQVALRARKDEAQNLRSAAMLEFMESAKYLTDLDRDRIEEALMDIAMAMEEVAEEELENKYEVLSRKLDTIETAERQLYSALPNNSEEEKVAWSALSERWRFLNDYVRLRVYEAGEAWIEPATYESLNGSIDGVESPISSAVGFVWNYSTPYFGAIRSALGHVEEMKRRPVLQRGMPQEARDLAGSAMLRLKNIQEQMVVIQSFMKTAEHSELHEDG